MTKLMWRLLVIVALLLAVQHPVTSALSPSLTSQPLLLPSTATDPSEDGDGEWFAMFQFGFPSSPSPAPIIITIPLSAVSVLPMTSFPPPAALASLYTQLPLAAPPATAITAPTAVSAVPTASSPLATSPLFALGTGQTPAAFFGGAPSGGAGLPSGLGNSVIAQVPTTGELFAPLGLLATLHGTGVSTAAATTSTGLTAFVTPGQANSALTPADLGALAQNSGLTALAAEIGSAPSTTTSAPSGLVGGIIGGSQLALGSALLSAGAAGSLGIFGSSVSPATAAAALGLSSPALRGGNVDVLDPSTGRAMTAAGIRGMVANGVRGQGGRAVVRGGSRGGAPAGLTFMGPMSGRASAMASLAALQAAAARAPQTQLGRGRGAGGVGGAFGVRGTGGGRSAGGGGGTAGGVGGAGPVGGAFGGRSTGGRRATTGTGVGFGGGGSRGGGGHGGGH